MHPPRACEQAHRVAVGRSRPEIRSGSEAQGSDVGDAQAGCPQQHQLVGAHARSGPTGGHQAAVAVTHDDDPGRTAIAQSKQLIELYAKLLRTLAATMPEDPTTVTTLNDTADALLAEAEAAGYPADFLSNPDTAPKSLTSEAFNAANTATAAKAQTQCASTTTAAGDAPTTTVAG